MNTDVVARMWWLHHTLRPTTHKLIIQQGVFEIMKLRKEAARTSRLLEAEQIANGHLRSALQHAFGIEANTWDGNGTPEMETEPLSEPHRMRTASTTKSEPWLTHRRDPIERAAPNDSN